MHLKLPGKITRFVILVVGAALIGTGAAAAFDVKDRSALWYVVNDLCRPMQQALNLPIPCLKVDAARGFVVLRAPGDETQILIVPTTKIDGIDSPIILQDRMPNLWSYAWSERSRVAANARRPPGWNDIGMAINSRRGRSQDQLHIHIDCVDPRLKQALASPAGRLSPKWSILDLRPWARRYRVKDIGAAGIDQNIFKLIAAEIPGARSRMALQSIGVIGSIGPNGDHGFTVLVNSDGGHAEELLDHTCSISK